MGPGGEARWERCEGLECCGERSRSALADGERAQVGIHRNGASVIRGGRENILLKRRRRPPLVPMDVLTGGAHANGQPVSRG